MTDQATGSEAANADIETIDGDPFLDLFVGLADKGAGFGITLYTAGPTISGQLVSRQRYFEMNSLLTAGTGFEKVFDAALEALTEMKSDEMGGNYTYVHLQSARIYAPGQSPMPAEGTLMRLRRSEVIGWSSGVLSYNPT